MPDTATSLDSRAGLMFHSADFISSRTHSQNDSEGTDACYIQAQEHHGLCPEGELEGARLVIGAYVKDSPHEENYGTRHVRYVEHLS